METKEISRFRLMSTIPKHSVMALLMLIPVLTFSYFAIFGWLFPIVAPTTLEKGIPLIIPRITFAITIYWISTMVVMLLYLVFHPFNMFKKSLFYIIGCSIIMANGLFYFFPDCIQEGNSRDMYGLFLISGAIIYLGRIIGDFFKKN